MPLDEFQKIVLRALMPRRTPKSVFAGGSVLQRHGFRISDDQDIFQGESADLVTTAMADVDALKEAGLEVDVGRPHEGLVEAVVGDPELGFTKVQWVEAGSWNFFEAVPDPDFGYRLHMADLAVNKVLAAGGRRVVRDYVDLTLVHRHVMPLWHAVWAAPAKDESWTPIKLLEKIAASNQFRQAELEQEVLSTVDLSAGEIGTIVRDAVEEARAVFERLPLDTAGHLFVDERGNLVNEVPRIVSGDEDISVIDATRGGTWPSGPAIDSALIDRVIESFGWEGSGAEPSTSVSFR